jgi:hypothetical protein
MFLSVIGGNLSAQQEVRRKDLLTWVERARVRAKKNDVIALVRGGWSANINKGGRRYSEAAIWGLLKKW